MPPIQPKWARRGFGIKTSTPSGGNGRRTEAGRPPTDPPRNFVRHQGLDLRLHNWLATWVVTPRDTSPAWFPRWTRFKRWAIGVYPRIREFCWVVRGPRITADRFEERNRICDGCPVLRIRLPARPGGRIRRFCGRCGCPDWPMAELSIKNTFERHVCPRGMHPRSPDWATELINQMIREESANDGYTG